MKKWLLGALALIIATFAVGAGLLLWTDIFITTVTVAVENRTSQAIEIAIVDQSIGCGDSDSVAPNTTSRVKLKLDGGILCQGVTNPYNVYVTTSGQGWVCFWGELEADPIIVVTDSGPDCGLRR